ncbi:MAG: ATP-dependent DNA helicase [Oscillospiraceae bacterium]|nr:ATP-dependent DNA helicase [Oscillospiraceae bacterium]
MDPVKISVHKVVDLVLRCGDIDSRYVDSSSIFDGAEAHRKIQKAMGGDYKKEVSLKLETQSDGIPVLLQGRADGIITGFGGSVTIDEIKTTTLPLHVIYEQREQHLGQGKCYAYMYLKTAENPPESVAVQLTYYQLDSGETERHKWEYTSSELESFFEGLMRKYGIWLRLERDFKALRDESIMKTDFPFPSYRRGQREMAVAAYRAIASGKKLYASAPTGIGKTLSALFPSIKTVGEGKAEKLFYLTAKTVTRVVAEDALRLMAAKGLRFKSITLRAKDKICFTEEKICDPAHCPYAKGHYDRVNEALYDLLNNNDIITPEITAGYSKKYRVCPHETALDAALWTDMVVGDYNHVFDPASYLRRFFGYDERGYVFLIDEAHNLADRVRDMYAAKLRKSAFYSLKNRLKGKDPFSSELRKTARQINQYLLDVRKEYDEKKSHVEAEQDMVFKALVILFSEAAGEWLFAKKYDSHELFGDILDLYFEVQMFLTVSKLYDGHFTTITEIYGGEVSVTLFCLDPSEIIAGGLSKARSSVLFSATLTPLPYYREILGGTGEDSILSLPSPFDPARLLTAAHYGISTKYKGRENSYAPIAQTIYTAISQKKGNYFAFFPSYDYMNRVYELFAADYPGVKTLLQQSEMDEAARAAFLAEFSAGNPETLVGFTVLGGIFSEGIDLKGERLIGSIIIGPGIPKISLRQEQIRDYFDRKNGQGYDYAYVYPGMNKVLQAAGRVIRTETDYGIVLLIDSRFNTAKYCELFPKHWDNVRMVRDIGELL